MPLHFSTSLFNSPGRLSSTPFVDALNTVKPKIQVDFHQIGFIIRNNLIGSRQAKSD